MNWVLEAVANDPKTGPEGPSTQYSRTLVPNTIKGMVLWPEALSIGYLDILSGTGSSRRFSNLQVVQITTMIKLLQDSCTAANDSDCVKESDTNEHSNCVGQAAGHGLL